MTNDHDLQPSALVRIVDDGHDLARAEKALNTRATGRWSKGGEADRTANFERHYRNHAEDLDPDWTREEYRRNARQLANRREGVNRYFQRSEDKGAIAVHDPTSERFVTKNSEGEIQTFFEADEGYVENLVDSGNAVQIS